MKTKQRAIKKYKDVWNGIKNKIEGISVGKFDYEKDYTKIKFNSDVELPLNKPLKFHIREDGKLYPQVFLDGALFALSI